MLNYFMKFLQNAMFFDNIGVYRGELTPEYMQSRYRLEVGKVGQL